MNCIICGAYVPEGRDVCPTCEKDINDMCEHKKLLKQAIKKEKKNVKSNSFNR